MAKVNRDEYDKAIAQLREWIKPGETVYTVLEHVSRSGMSRTIRVLIPALSRTHRDTCAVPSGLAARCDCPGTGIDFLHPNHAVALVTGHSLDKGRGRDGIKVGGCGMDMGFSLVYDLSHKLYGGKACDCGAWYDDARPGQRFTREDYHAREGGGRSSDGWHYRYDPACPKCKGAGNVIGTGYQCLGKGKCPSNYHSNHRDRLRCEGVERGDEWVRCGRPADRHFWGGRREEIPADWPVRKIPIGDTGETVDLPLTTLFTAEGDYGREVCPACGGEGDIANPAGPERFDLEHFDGYAIRQRWL